MNIPKDQAIRDLITGNNSIEDLNHAQFVKAGAGAGKTTSIKQRVLNLVSKKNLSLDKMVIITYTTKAANELMVRIREELEANHTLPNVEGALIKLTDAKISTFHAFCYDLLKEYPIEFCIDPELQLADDSMTEIMLENCFSLMMQECNDNESKYSGEFADQMNSFNDLLDVVKTGDLKKTFLSLYQNRDLTPIKVDTSKFKDLSSLEADIFKWIGEYYLLIQQLYYEIIDGKENDPMFVFMEDNLRAFINTKKTKSDFINHIQDGNESLVFSGNKGAVKNYNTPEILKKIKCIAKELKTTFKYIENTNKILNYNLSVETYPYFEKIVEEYKSLYGFIDFFDCIYLVKKKLDTDEHLRKLVQNRFDVVIIDEFQDSDPMQAEIAFHLAGDNTNKLLFVGDPKQSIYGFSRADISVYLDVMDRIEQMPNGELLELSTNFRSSGGLLDFVNDNFEKILIRSKERKSISVDYTRMEKSSQKEKSQFKTAHWTVSLQLDSENKKPTAATTKPREAFMVASQIQKMMKEDESLSAGDILILFRSSTSMEYYEKALKQLDIPVLNTKSKNFLKRSEVIELLNLLALSAFPKENFYKYCILESNLISIDEETLDEILSSNLSFDSKFRTLCNVAGFTSLAVKSNDDIYIQFIENLCSLARTELIANNYDLKRTFSNLFEKAINDSFFSGIKLHDESVSLQTEKSNTVTLMTIHSSKGLESRVVIMSAHDAKPFPDKQYVDRINDQILVESPFLSSKRAEELECKQLEELYEKEGQRREEEEKRVLYVGVTRAEEQFILVSHSDGALNKAFIKTLLDPKPEFSESLELKIDDVKTSFENQKYHNTIEFDESIKDLSSFSPSVLSDVISNNGLSKPVTTLIDNPELFKNIDGRKNGKDFGTFTHLVMEYVCSIIFHKKDLNINTNTLVDKLYDGFSVKLESTYIDELKNMATLFLSSELAKDILDADAIYTEIPFSSSENYHGVIDLILEKGNKVRIIDFKSDLLKTKKAEIKAHYKNQIEYYMRALKQYTDKDIEGECLYLFESI